MHSRPLQAGKNISQARHPDRPSIVSQLESRINMTTLEPDPARQRWRINTLAPSA